MKSILSKLWLGITSLVIIILLIIWLFQIGLLNKFYINERTNILLEEGYKIANIFLDSDNYNSVSQEIIDEIESFAPPYSARIIISNLDNDIIFYNAPKNYFRSNKLPADEIQQDFLLLYNDQSIKQSILEMKPFILQKNDDRSHRQSITVGVPIKKDNTQLGYIILSSPISPIKETVSILKKQLSIISIVSLLIGTLLALLFAKIFTKPILKINETTKKIAKGDFEARVSLDYKDEIGVLGDSINNMAFQLGQIEKFRKDFIANTSHELKTPISLITAYAELVKDIDLNNKEDKIQYLQIIIDEANRLNKMVEDILYLSKMESGYIELNYETFSILKVINNVVEKLNFFANKKNIELVIDIDDNNTFVYGDEDKICQVFYNIINNAINHSYEHGKLIIRVVNLENLTRVEIIDNGKGIPKDDLPYIWDRFYKVDKSRKRDHSGTGLGMSIVKNILEAHNFDYGIKSEVNKGTTVWFEIKSGEN